MAWTNSKGFAAMITSVMNRANGVIDCDADTFKNALFDNSVTPSNTVTAANSAYNAGVWAAGGVSDATGWPAVGRNLTSVSSSDASGTYTFTAATTSSANSTTTLAAFYGCLIYDDTAATTVDQGYCYLYLGGANQVTNGSASVAYSGSGILTAAT